MNNTKYQQLIKNVYKNEFDLFSNNFKTNKTDKELCFYIKGSDTILNYNIINLFYQDLLTENNNYIFLSSGNSYLKQFPWQSFKNMFFDFFNIDGNSKYLKKKIIRFVREARYKFPKSINYISELFSSDCYYEEGNPLIPLSKSIIFKAFQNFFYFLSKNKRIVIFLDKIDTFDDMSFELIFYLIHSLKDSNIIFVMSSSENYIEKLNNIDVFLVNLDDFNKDSCKLAIYNILKADVDEKLLNYIYERIDNKLYYIEVLINYLVDNDLIIKEDGKYILKKDDYVSLSSIFISTVGKLNESEANLLELISFFGDRVSYDILNQLYNGKNFDENLDNLSTLGFVYKSSINNQCFINFSSDEIKESIYNNIFPATKQDIHLKIVSFLKNVYKDGYSPIYEILAYHLENAFLFYDAIYFYFMAGLKYYSDLFDKKNAHKWFKRALYIAKQLILNNRNSSVFCEETINCFNNSFYKMLFTYYLQLPLDIATIFYYTALTSEDPNEKIQDYYFNAIKYGEQYNNTAIIFLSKLEIFKIHFTDNEDVSMLKNYMSQIEDIAKKSGNQFFMIFLLIVNVSLYISNESYKLDNDQIEKFITSKDLLLDNNIFMDKEQKRALLIFWYFCYANYLKISYNGPSKTDIIKNIVSEGENYLLHDYDKINYHYRLAIKPLNNTVYKPLYLKKSLEVSLAINNSFYTSRNYEELGRLFFEQGEYDEAIDYYQKAEPLLIELDDRERLSDIYKNIAYIYIIKKYYIDAIQLLKKSIENKNSENIYSPSAIKEDSVIYVILSLIFVSIQIGDYELSKEYFNRVDEILLYKKNIMSESILLFYNFLVSYLKLKKDGDTLQWQNIKGYVDIILKDSQKSTYKIWLKKFISEIDELPPLF